MKRGLARGWATGLGKGIRLRPGTRAEWRRKERGVFAWGVARGWRKHPPGMLPGAAGTQRRSAHAQAHAPVPAALTIPLCRAAAV